MKKLLSILSACVVMFVLHVTPAFAGTDLSVNCTAIGTCTITPAATPLYQEAGWLPGSTVTQKLTVKNASAQDGYTGIQVMNYTDTNSVGQVINIQVHRNAPNGPVVYSAVSLITFKNDGYFTISPISAGQTVDYYFTATMLSTAGNQYQGSQAKFDLKVGLELTPIAPPSGGNGGGGGGSAPNNAQPPVCSANAPGSAPSVNIVNSGANTVTLSWTPVSPVTHYGLYFRRNSDGAEYGAPNIGNVTSYTITNLGGQASYTFEIFGVNDCAPGPRGRAGSATIAGGVTTGRPLGTGGQVLGVTTASPSPSASPTISPAPSPSATPSVLGDKTCSDFRWWWVPMVIYAIVIVVMAFVQSNNHTPRRVVTIVGFGLTALFLYFWKCQPWPWIIGTGIGGAIVELFTTFLMSDDETEQPPESSTAKKV